MADYFKITVRLEPQFTHFPMNMIAISRKSSFFRDRQGRGGKSGRRREKEREAVSVAENFSFTYFHRNFSLSLFVWNIKYGKFVDKFCLFVHFSVVPVNVRLVFD